MRRIISVAMVAMHTNVGADPDHARHVLVQAHAHSAPSMPICQRMNTQGSSGRNSRRNNHEGSLVVAR